MMIQSGDDAWLEMTRGFRFRRTVEAYRGGPTVRTPSRDKFGPIRAASIVRRSGGSLRTADAMGRVDHARRGDESRRLTCLPRWPGEASSPSRFLSSGLAADSGLLAFAAPTAAQTSHSCRYKRRSVDGSMQDRFGIPVYTVSIHSKSSSSRPGRTILGTVTNPLTVRRKTNGIPGAVARRSIGNRHHWRTRGKKP